MKRKIIIRTDANASTGMGHLIRCLALADMLKKEFTIVFAVQEPEEKILRMIHSVTGMVIALPRTENYIEDSSNFCKFLNEGDIVVLDGYYFKTDYQRAVKEKNCRLVVIDDLHAWHHIADAIINHAENVSPKSYSTEEYTKLYLGFDYILLRKEFLTTKKKERIISSVEKVFLSMGGGDVNNLSSKFTEALMNLAFIKEIHVMLGTVNPNLESIKLLAEKSINQKILIHFDITAAILNELLQQCDLSICPASSIALESCAVGTGLISGITAENQKGILNGLIKHESAIDLGDMNMITREDITGKIKAISNAPQILNKLIKNQSKMIDGKSPERMLEIFRSL